MTLFQTSTLAVTRRACAGTLVVILCSAPGSAFAKKLLFEDDATAAGQTVVDQAAHGDTAAAFQSALALRSPTDEVLPGIIEQQKVALGAQTAAPGTAGRARLVGQSHFGGCIENEYRVSSGSGADQLWTLKFRRGVGGWQLSNLFVRKG